MEYYIRLGKVFAIGLLTVVGICFLMSIISLTDVAIAQTPSSTNDYTPMPVPEWYISPPERIEGKAGQKTEFVQGGNPPLDLINLVSPTQGGKLPLFQYFPQEIKDFSKLELVPTPISTPFEYVVWIKVKYTDSQGTYICSGSLIDSQHVLAPAHCIDNPRLHPVKFTEPEYIQVIPASDGGKGPYGYAIVKDWHFDKRWLDVWKQEKFEPNFDWAILRLDRPVGALTGWFGYKSQPDDSTFTSPQSSWCGAGYPMEGNYNKGKMYYWKGYFDQSISYPTKPPLLLNNSGALHGQSGFGVFNREINDFGMGKFYSPSTCWLSNAQADPRNKYFIHAVLVGNVTAARNITHTVHVRINSDIFQQIQSYISQTLVSQAKLIPLATSAELGVGDTIKLESFVLHNHSSKPYKGPVYIRAYIWKDGTFNPASAIMLTPQSLVKDIRDLTYTTSVRIQLHNLSIPCDTPPGTYALGIGIRVKPTDTDEVSHEQDTGKITIKYFRACSKIFLPLVRRR